MIHFLVNPTASSGRGGGIWNQINAVLSQSDVPVTTHMLTGPGEATRLTASITAKEPGCTIVAVGGDGTINEVINGISRPSQVTFACIPTGSGNDFCRGMGLHGTPADLTRRILHPVSVRPIDIGVVSDGTHTRRFAVSSGIGWDAEVCYHASASRMKAVLNRLHLGQLIYAVVALQRIFFMKRQPLRIRIDGGESIRLKNGFLAAAMNTAYEGGGFRFCPDAVTGDGRLDYFYAHNMSRPSLLFVLPRAHSGHHLGIKGIKTGRFTTMTVENETPLCVHTDGEHFGFARSVTFSIHPEQLPVIL